MSWFNKHIKKPIKKALKKTGDFLDEMGAFLGINASIDRIERPIKREEQRTKQIYNEIQKQNELNAKRAEQNKKIKQGQANIESANAKSNFNNANANMGNAIGAKKFNNSNTAMNNSNNRLQG